MERPLKHTGCSVPARTAHQSIFASVDELKRGRRTGFGPHLTPIDGRGLQGAIAYVRRKLLARAPTHIGGSTRSKQAPLEHRQSP